MPQIGWLELLIIVVIAILVIGTKDFPVVLKKLGKWSNISLMFNQILMKLQTLMII